MGAENGAGIERAIDVGVRQPAGAKAQRPFGAGEILRLDSTQPRYDFGRGAEIGLLKPLIALALVFEKTRTAALYASLVLMLAFTVYAVLILLHFFTYVPCSCGGVIKRLTWKQHLVFNLFFDGLAVAGILLRKKAHTTSK